LDEVIAISSVPFWECLHEVKALMNVDIQRFDQDETLPNFIKRKHPRKGGKKKQGARTKVQASKHPKRGGPQGGKGTTKY
jgi:hypothetical protein